MIFVIDVEMSLMNTQNCLKPFIAFYRRTVPNGAFLVLDSDSVRKHDIIGVHNIGKFLVLLHGVTNCGKL